MKTEIPYQCFQFSLDDITKEKDSFKNDLIKITDGENSFSTSKFVAAAISQKIKKYLIGDSNIDSIELPKRGPIHVIENIFNNKIPDKLQENKDYILDIGLFLESEYIVSLLVPKKIEIDSINETLKSALSLYNMNRDISMYADLFVRSFNPTQNLSIIISQISSFVSKSKNKPGNLNDFIAALIYKVVIKNGYPLNNLEMDLSQSISKTATEMYRSGKCRFTLRPGFEFSGIMSRSRRPLLHPSSAELEHPADAIFADGEYFKTKDDDKKPSLTMNFEEPIIIYSLAIEYPYDGPKMVECTISGSFNLINWKTIVKFKCRDKRVEIIQLNCVERYPMFRLSAADSPLCVGRLEFFGDS